MTPARFAALLIVTLAAPAARGDVIILVTPSVGPNVFNSPSYDGYRDYALGAILAGSPSAGAPGSPSFYQAVPSGGSVQLTDLVVTGFPSWRGKADPGAAFGPAFAAETGTRLYFGLSILPQIGTPHTQFSIAQLSFNATSTDPLHTLDLGLGYEAGTYDYSDDYVGLILNPDGSIQQRITSGPNTQLVDALIGRGTTNAFEVLPSDPGATDQERIDGALAGRDGFAYTGTYSLGAQSGGATVNVTTTPVPAPPSLVVFGVGLVALSVRRWRAR